MQYLNNPELSIKVIQEEMRIVSWMILWQMPAPKINCKLTTDDKAIAIKLSTTKSLLNGWTWKKISTSELRANLHNVNQVEKGRNEVNSLIRTRKKRRMVGLLSIFTVQEIGATRYDSASGIHTRDDSASNKIIDPHSKGSKICIWNWSMEKCWL